MDDPVRHASFASGIGGFDLGFDQAGIECVFQCEIDPFCLSILARHWPNVPKAHDLRSLKADGIPDRMRAPARLPRRLDSPRYRTLGNAVTVNVARWIGLRLVSNG